MSGKPGMTHADPGPKINPPPYPVGAVGDPAHGAKVKRCRACGLPNPADLVGLRGGVPGRFPICDRCWAEVNGPDPRLPNPRDTDPLHVPEDS